MWVVVHAWMHTCVPDCVCILECVRVRVCVRVCVCEMYMYACVSTTHCNIILDCRHLVSDVARSANHFCGCQTSDLTEGAVSNGYHQILCSKVRHHDICLRE